LIADIVSGRPSPIGLVPYRPQRFGSGQTRASSAENHLAHVD